MTRLVTPGKRKPQAMRRGKLISLKLDDINRDSRKDRVVPIGRRALDWIEKDARPSWVFQLPSDDVARFSEPKSLCVDKLKTR